jgi:hypothetical protein
VPVIGELVDKKADHGREYHWNTIDLLADWPNWSPGGVADEIAELVELIEYRPGVMSEALAERTELATYYCGLLMFSRSPHPNTFDLAQIATTVARFVAMHYKRKIKRPRPSQLSPALMPPIAVPGHASFPSGHATAAYLISGLLAKVMPSVVTDVLPPRMDQSGYPAGASLLTRLAERIARNREVLGLHYPSDSAAGKFLADRTLELIVQCDTVKDLLPHATAEWAPAP